MNVVAATCSPVWVVTLTPLLPISRRFLVQQLYYGQGAHGFPPQPTYGFQQQLLPGIRPGIGPNFILPYPLQRQGQPGQRVGPRRGGTSQQMQHQQQQFQRNANQGYRYMSNVRNGLDPSMVPQGLMNPMVAMPFDLSGMYSGDGQQPGPMPISALASALASASPERQREMLEEQLFPLVEHLEPNNARKVTGMLLEMDETEVLHLIESPDALKRKVVKPWIFFGNLPIQML